MKKHPDIVIQADMKIPKEINKGTLTECILGVDVYWVDFVEYTYWSICDEISAKTASVKPVWKRPLSKRPQIKFQDQSSLNAG